MRRPWCSSAAPAPTAADGRHRSRPTVTNSGSWRSTTAASAAARRPGAVHRGRHGRRHGAPARRARARARTPVGLVARRRDRPIHRRARALAGVERADALELARHRRLHGVQPRPAQADPRTRRHRVLLRGDPAVAVQRSLPLHRPRPAHDDPRQHPRQHGDLRRPARSDRGEPDPRPHRHAPPRWPCPRW